MQEFSSLHVDVRFLAKNRAKLLEDFSYENNQFKITVKKGFIFDGASVPRFFWRVVGHPFSYALIRAALVHDVMYASEYFKREVADELFSEMLDISGVSELKEDVMTLGVRIGGGDVWDEHTQESVLDALNYIKVVEK